MISSVPDPESAHRRFRPVVVVVSVVVAVIGSVVLVTRGSGSAATTRGVTATLRVPDHPGSVAAGTDALWLALTDAQRPVRDRPLLRLDLASGSRAAPDHRRRSGQVPRARRRPIARLRRACRRQRIRPEHDRRLRLAKRPSPRSPTVPDGRGTVAVAGRDLWALQARPAALLRLDPLTLLPKAAPLSLSSGAAYWPGRRRWLRLGDGLRGVGGSASRTPERMRSHGSTSTVSGGRRVRRGQRLGRRS